MLNKRVILSGMEFVVTSTFIQNGEIFVDLKPLNYNAPLFFNFSCPAKYLEFLDL